MRKLVVHAFMSVDGVVQAPGGPDDDREGKFAHGGWLVPHFDDELSRRITHWHEHGDALLIGHKTYDILAAHWPYLGDDDPLAAKLNRMPKYVAGRDADTAKWHNTTLLGDDVVADVAALKERPGREIQVVGSSDLLQTLMRHDLVDEYRLWIFPVLLGSGKRLFANGTQPAGLALTDTAISSTGVAMYTYERLGTPTYGSFALHR